MNGDNIGTVGQPGPLVGSTKSDQALSFMEVNGKQWYAGKMDEISVWNTALNGAQVQELWNGGSAGDLLTHSAVASGLRWGRCGEFVNLPVMIDAFTNTVNLPSYGWYRLRMDDNAIGGGLNKRIQAWDLFNGSTMLVADMTDNTTPAPYEADASINAVDAWKCFDRNTSTHIQLGVDPTGQWVEITTTPGSPITITHFRLRSWGSSRAIGTFTLQGSNDGVNLVDIQTWTNTEIQFDEVFVVSPFALMANIVPSDFILDAP